MKFPQKVSHCSSVTLQDLTWTSSTMIKRHLSSFEEAAECFRHKLYTPTERKRALSVLCPRPLITPAASVFMLTVAEHDCLLTWMDVYGRVCCKRFSHSSPCTPELLSAEPVIILAGIYTPHISSKLFPLWLSFKGVGEESDEETGFFLLLIRRCRNWVIYSVAVTVRVLRRWVTAFRLQPLTVDIQISGAER